MVSFRDKRNYQKGYVAAEATITEDFLKNKWTLIKKKNDADQRVEGWNNGYEAGFKQGKQFGFELGQIMIS